MKTLSDTAKNLPNKEMTQDELISLVLQCLDDDKAEEIVSIDLRGKSAFVDYMVVASGRSQRHVGAVADHLVRKLKNLGEKSVQIEGVPNCDWVLVDTGDVVVHIFRPEVRDFYNIEKMWMANMADADSDVEQDVEQIGASASGDED